MLEAFGSVNRRCKELAGRDQRGPRLTHGEAVSGRHTNLQSSPATQQHRGCLLVPPRRFPSGDLRPCLAEAAELPHRTSRHRTRSQAPLPRLAPPRMRRVLRQGRWGAGDSAHAFRAQRRKGRARCASRRRFLGRAVRMRLGGAVGVAHARRAGRGAGCDCSEKPLRRA